MGEGPFDMFKALTILKTVVNRKYKSIVVLFKKHIPKCPNLIEKSWHPIAFYNQRYQEIFLGHLPMNTTLYIRKCSVMDIIISIHNYLQINLYIHIQTFFFSSGHTAFLHLAVIQLEITKLTFIYRIWVCFDRHSVQDYWCWRWARGAGAVDRFPGGEFTMSSMSISDFQHRSECITKM